MRDLIKTVIQFVRTYFSWRLYLSYALFAAAIISFYYVFHYERTFLAPLMRQYWTKFLFYTVFYAFAFYGVVFISFIFDKKKVIGFDKTFWIRSGLAMIVLGNNEAMQCFQFIKDACPMAVCPYVIKIFNNTSSLFTTLLPLWIIYLLFDRKKVPSFYGLTFKNVNFRPLLGMFLFMIPLVTAASFTDDFQSYYPIYKRTHGPMFSGYLGIHEIYAIIMFEIVYLLDFINTELLFRGFFVMSFSRNLKHNVILPMTMVYCMIHFGKPPLEAISAIFGGYILGVKAFDNKNIWCGVVIHMGIAFLMEILAFMHMAYR